MKIFKTIFNVLNPKVTLNVIEHVVKDCESEFSLYEIDILEKDIIFQNEKKDIFSREVGKRYLKSHNIMVGIRIVSIFFLAFFLMLFIISLFTGLKDESGLFLGAAVSAAFLFFSISPNYTEYEKYIYDFYFNEYKNLLTKHIKLLNNGQNSKDGLEEVKEERVKKLKNEIMQELRKELKEVIYFELVSATDQRSNANNMEATDKSND